MRFSTSSAALLTSVALFGCPSGETATPADTDGSSSGDASSSSEGSSGEETSAPSTDGDTTSSGGESSGTPPTQDASCPDYAAMPLDALLLAGPGQALVDGVATPVVDVEFGEVEGSFAMIAVLGENTFLGVPLDLQTEEPTGTVWLLEGDAFYSGPAEVSYVEDVDAVMFGAAVVADEGGATRELSSCFLPGAGSSNIVVDGTTATLRGALGSLTFTQIERLQAEHPEIELLVLSDVPGSINDEVNVETGRLVRNGGWATHLPADGEIASGGVDLYCAGVERTMEPGGRIGVHSWSNGEVEGADLPMDSPEHTFFIDYLQEMLGAPRGRDFYFFTLQAAPAAGIHWMTPEEIEQYGLLSGS
jgi:hypothetical protein